jgi:peptidoglycan/xylan/chitin deacetylase (PgdA/CDA1 family)
MSTFLQPGALVISLDFELHWGIRDKCPPDGAYITNIRGARTGIPAMLALFERYQVAATWAAVGLLFARNREEQLAFSPAIRPHYANSRMNPYLEPVGRNEDDDPLHFGHSLLCRIAETPRQEIASHTYCHYFCLEEGQTIEAFRADLDAAQRIARETLGIQLRSIAFPRNQFRPEYLPALAETGFTNYRGNQAGFFYKPNDNARQTSSWMRAGRFIDAYIPVSASSLVPWSAVRNHPHGLADVRASRFLRPFHPRLRWIDRTLRVARMKNEMRQAARQGCLYHLWWHPHNFGLYTSESLQILDGLLREYCDLRDRFGFESLTMAEAAQFANAGVGGLAA